MKMLTFTVSLPPRELSPNGRVHWRAKSRAVAEYRADCWYLALGASNGWATPDRARVSLAFGTKRDRLRPGYRPTDPDNAWASMKACLDGMRDANVLRQDDHGALELGSVTIDPKADPGLTITVEAI